MSTDKQTSADASDKLARLREYWRARSGGTRLPARRDIDPVDLPRHLSTILLIDGCGSEGIPRRFRFRLIGTGLSRLMPKDPTSRPLDEVLDGAEMAAVGALLTPVVEDGAEAMVSGRLVWAGGWSLPADWLFLPLAADGRTVDMILGYADFPALPMRLPAGRPRLTFPGAPRGVRGPLVRKVEAGGLWFRGGESRTAALGAP